MPASKMPMDDWARRSRVRFQGGGNQLSGFFAGAVITVLLTALPSPRASASPAPPPHPVPSVHKPAATDPGTARNPAPVTSAIPPPNFDPRAFGEITSSTLPLENGHRIALRVNGIRITWEDFIAHIRLTGASIYQQHPGQEANIAAALSMAVKDGLVLIGLYRQFAAEHHLEPEAREVQRATASAIAGKDPQVKAALRLLTPDQITTLVTDNLTRDKVDKYLGDRATSAPPTAAELTSFTQQVRPTTSPITILRASHIVVRATPDMSDFNINDAKARAEEIRAKIVDAGSTATAIAGSIHQDFAALARQYSQDRFTAYRGGDLGYFPAGSMYPAVNDALEKLEPGQVSPVVRSPVGFHIFKLTERYGNDLRLQYDKWRRQQAVAHWKTEAGDAAKIENYIEKK